MAMIVYVDTQTNGGMVVNTTRITEADSPYTALVTDHHIFCDTDGGDITVNLPAGIDGTQYIIYNTGSSGNTLTNRYHNLLWLFACLRRPNRPN